MPTVVSSGLSVGVPGTPALWDLAARRYGTRSLSMLLAPAEKLARQGFVVDPTYVSQTSANVARFRKFPETVRVYLPGGRVPAVGSTVRNRYVGDVSSVPTRQLVGQRYVDARACGHFDDGKAQVRPIPFGDPQHDSGCDRAASPSGR